MSINTEEPVKIENTCIGRMEYNHIFGELYSAYNTIREFYDPEQRDYNFTNSIRLLLHFLQ
jgi:hypothetical protein